jgi:hypothetical protein
VRVFQSLPDALKDGWTVYDRWTRGIVLTQRIAGRTEVAMVEFESKADGDPEC